MEPHLGTLRSPVRWTDAIVTRRVGPQARGGRFALAVLPGEGIGPEVIGAALSVLSAVVEAGGPRFEVRKGGAIGREAEAQSGRTLTEEVAAFCGEAFAAGAPILAGPGGGRFVYDLRRRFDLFCKISPLCPLDALAHAGRLKVSAVAGTDILILRENVGGVYQGDWSEGADSSEGRVCDHRFRYTERQVRRVLEGAARLAARRRGLLAVVVKEGGIPGISALWRALGGEAAARAGVTATFPDVDLIAYRLIQEPRAFDVIAAPNLFGDVLADLGAVLLGSRGLSFSGNFSEDGAAVYQTNHGSAVDLAGLDRANPLGQIASLAMLLRESLGLHREAGWIEAGVADVLRLGFRTFDVLEEGTTLIGTAEMGERIASAVARLARAGA
jgi:3-isopropylmalate dehydrogenase